MTERPPSNASPMALPSGPVLVATKLHAPEPRPGLVSRTRLVSRLVEGADRKLTLVCAPAGWGKTVLLTQWQAADAATRSFAWVQLDARDDDQVRLWGHVIGALRTIEPDVGRESLAALPVAGLGLIDAVLAPLINELAGNARRIVLVLDDYHFIHDRRIHESVAFLLRHLPPNVRLAIASRSDPPLPLGSLRASGQLTEIRAAQLGFTDGEARELLNGSLALELDPGDVDLLQSRTEGWAAGLQLAALSVRGAENRHAFVMAFSGADRQIGDYLHEVLADQLPERREFLLRTSILERMSASLCEAVTGRADSAEQLEAADRSNLFIVSLDARREWYRYHPLFGELLRVELMRTAPQLVPELHRRASAWHKERGDIDEAIAHATAARDFAEASELIASWWRPIWSAGQFETVARWIDALPHDVVLADARLCLARGWAALYMSEPVLCDHWRRLAEQAPLPAPLRDGTTSVPEAAAILQAAHANLTGDAGGAVQAARRALAHNRDEAARSRVVANVHLGMGAYYAGELGTAEAAFEEALRSSLAREWASVRVVALGNLAVIRIETGELDRAASLLAETERAIEDFGVNESSFASRFWIAQGKLLEARGDLAAAETAFQRAVTLARRVSSQLAIAHGLLAQVMLMRRRGRQAEARAHAREARQLLAACPDPGILREILARTERSLQLTPARSASPAAAVDGELSERELAVLRLMASELSQREIGARLYISFNTVKSHSRTILRKLGVRSRADAVARGRDLGLL